MERGELGQHPINLVLAPLGSKGTGPKLKRPVIARPEMLSVADRSGTFLMWITHRTAWTRRFLSDAESVTLMVGWGIILHLLMR